MPVLVVDASLAVAACTGAATLSDLSAELIAPGLLWSETLSVLHEMGWRGELAARTARAARDGLSGLSVRRDDPGDLRSEAWRVADELGWAKTYDAEYLALARLRSSRVVTLDRRLRRGAARTGLVVHPTEL